ANAYKHLYGEILQIRNTTGNADQNKWEGVGSLWLVFTHDLILDKDNVLHRLPFYEVSLNGVQNYEGGTVYEIAFDCKKPGAYTVGFGYPSPEAAKGKLFIDTENYAVVRHEACIERKPLEEKNHKTESWHHHLIQTYKKYNGQYFLHHSKQVELSVSTKAGKKTEHTRVCEFLMTETITENLRPSTVPLTRLKVDSKAKYDERFWQTHNQVTADTRLKCTVCEVWKEK
nr:hypothetical protein [Cytophagales bacterium]